MPLAEKGRPNRYYTKDDIKRFRSNTAILINFLVVRSFVCLYFVISLDDFCTHIIQYNNLVLPAFRELKW